MIRFREFTKHYGADVAVAGLSLDVERGEIVALVGPNGSGKTTSLKAAAGLIRPTAGTVVVGDPGRPAIEPGARAALSFMPQRVSFAEAVSGREVVSFYCGLRGLPVDRGLEVLRFASLNGAADRPVASYSGGMVQRLGLAVALIPRAPVLVLDEPAAALDPAGLSSFYDALSEQRRSGGSVFFSTHQIGDIEQLADRFALLIGGRLAAVMSREELRDRLAARGRMRILLGVAGEDALEVARKACPGATLSGRDLIVPALARERPGILEHLRAGGVTIEAIATEEGTLEELYRELVRREEQE